MNKTDFRKSGLISAMLVALVCMVFVPAVIADEDWSESYSFHGEGVGAGVKAANFGSYYYYCYWHVGRWLGEIESFDGDLYFTLYTNGSPWSSSTPNDTYDDYDYGPLESLGASAYSWFYDSEAPYGYFYWSSGLASLP